MKLIYITIVVDDYDRAIEYYTEKLGFILKEDKNLSKEKRWVVVTPPGSNETSVLLAKASTYEQKKYIGRQTGGRVFAFLHTDDFGSDYEKLLKKGINFIEKPRKEKYGTVVVFKDIYGNKWDLLQLK
jgi:catechol 2,3-dioxygenase-like lactoylglutathione lyase family enzyme